VALRKSLASPDLTTLGRVIGGGLPVGAYGGRRKSCRWLHQLGCIKLGHFLVTLAMTAGIKTLELLQSQVPTSISTILLKKLADGLLQIAKETGHGACGSNHQLCSAYSSPQGQSITTRMPRRRTYLSSAAFIAVCLERGIYLAPSQ